MPYNPTLLAKHGLGSSRFARRYLGNVPTLTLRDTRNVHVRSMSDELVSFPPGTEMFHFPGYAFRLYIEILRVCHKGFPHSEIFGSKVARHLPEAYRRHAASFIASLESRHPPYALRFLLGNLKTTIHILYLGKVVTFPFSCIDSRPLLSYSVVNEQDPPMRTKKPPCASGVRSNKNSLGVTPTACGSRCSLYS